MADIKDVANYTGMSISTVSRVVNNYEFVKPETRKKVELAIKKLGYEPNEIAQRLKNNTSDILGVVVPDISNPFFATVVKGIQMAANSRGYQTLLCDTSYNSEAEQKAISLLIRQKAVGIVCATVASESASQKIYGNVNGNIVFIDNTPPIEKNFTSITINNYLAAKELVSLLTMEEHIKIATIAGPETESAARDRLKGYKSVLKEKNIPLPKEYIRFGDFREESGRREMKELLNLKEPPTAVFAANNYMAYGAYSTIREHGMKVPDDIAIATFDIFDTTGLIKHKFIGVSQPAHDMGRIAAEILIKPNDMKGYQKIVLEHEINN